MSADLEAPSLYVKVFAPGASTAQRFDLSGRVTEIEFEDVEAGADKLTLTLDNYDLSLFDEPNLKKGNMLEVSWGYIGQMRDAQECVIQKVTGATKVKVEALAKSILMAKTVKSRLFEHMKRSDVARKIAAEYGYTGNDVDIDDTEVVLPSITQAKVTDAAFLTAMAAREKFQFYVDASGFHFVRRKMNKAPTMVLEYFTDPGIGDIIDWNVENDITAKPGAITARGRDPMKKSTIDVTANDGNTPRTTLGETIEIVDPETKTTTTIVQNVASTYVGQTTATSAEAAKREVAGAFISAQQTAVVLKIAMRGRPRLNAKSIIEIRGIGKRLSGRYYVKNAKSKIGSDYTMDLLCRSDGTASGKGSTNVRSKDGTVNTKPDADQTGLVPVEIVDAETKQTKIGYRKVEQ